MIEVRIFIQHLLCLRRQCVEARVACPSRQQPARHVCLMVTGYQVGKTLHQADDG